MQGKAIVKNNDKLRIGIALDESRVLAWQQLLITTLAESDILEICGLITVRSPQQKKLARKSLYHLLMNIENRLNPNPALEPVDTVGVCQYFPVKFDTQFGDGIYSVEKKVFEELKEMNLDVILQLTLDVIDRSISQAARFGLWKFTHGLDGNIKGPPGFWEVIKNKDYNRTNLVMTNQETSFNLYSSYSATNNESINKNYQRFQLKCTNLALRSLKLLHQQRAEFTANLEKDELNGFRDNEVILPTNRELMIPLLGYVTRQTMKKLNKILFHEDWVLLFSFNRNYSQFQNFKSIIPPKGIFWADPFVIAADGEHHIYVEEVINKKKGHIAVITIDQNGKVSNPKTVLDKPYHMSYPFVFRWENNWYMIPESSGNSTIEIYKCLELPEKWAFHQEIMANIDAADSTLLKYGDYWWMFTNLREFKNLPNWDELHLYYTNNPFDNNWKPHPMNPIVSDVRKARPAGNLFVENGRLFRPAQNCSKRYGYGINIMEVETLSTTQYGEKLHRSIVPDWGAKYKAVHTLNMTGDFTIIDAKYKRLRSLFKSSRIK